MLIKDIIHANIESCTFELAKDKSKGRMVFDLNLTLSTSQNSLSVKYSLPIYSIWIDNENNNAIRVFCNSSNSDRNKILLKVMKKFNCLGIYGHGSNVLTCHGNIVRYGIKSGLIAEIEDSDYVTHEIFESKTKMLHSIFDTIKSCKQIGGFDTCALEKIPDRFFQIFGFTSIDDYFERMPPMWKARPSLILNPETNNLYNRYSYSRDLIKKRGELFLEVIKAILSGTSVIDAVKKKKGSL